MVMYEPAKKESQIATNITPQILDDDRWQKYSRVRSWYVEFDC